MTSNFFDVEEFRTSINGIDDVNSIEDFHVWSLDGIDSVLTLKVSINNWKNQEKIKKEIYGIASKYHIVDITIEFE